MLPAFLKVAMFSAEDPTFDVRRLKLSELPRWFDFLADVFAVNHVPREYFVRHWDNDPYKEVDAIFVAVPTTKNDNQEQGVCVCVCFSFFSS